MSWLTIKLDVRPLEPLLLRIAEALERIAPEVEPVPLDLKPEDAVQYVDEEKMERAEAIREIGSEAERLLEYARDHPEEFPEVAR